MQHIKAPVPKALTWRPDDELTERHWRGRRRAGRSGRGEEDDGRRSGSAETSFPRPPPELAQRQARARARARGDRAGGAKGHLDSPRLARPHPPSLPQHALPTAPARAQSPPVWHRPLEVLRRSRTRDCRAFTGVDALPDEHARPELDLPRADRAQWQARRTDRPAARTQGLALSRPAAGTDAGSSSSGCRGEVKRQGQASTEAPRTRCVDPPIGPPLRPPSPRHADSYDLAALRNDEQLPLPQKPRARSSTLSLSLRPRRCLRCSRTSPRSGRPSRQRAGNFQHRDRRLRPRRPAPCRPKQCERSRHSWL